MGAPSRRRPRPRHRLRDGLRLGLAAVFVLTLMQALLTPAQAAVQTPKPGGASASPSTSASTSAEPGGAGKPSASPSAPAGGGVDEEQVPVSGMTPGPSTAAGQARITLVLFDGDIVLVGGRGFGPDEDVAVTAATNDLGGSATAHAGADGRFILGFQVPTDFAGTVTVTAKQSAAEASGTLDVVASGAPVETPAEPVEPAEPAQPAPTSEPAESGAPSTPTPSARPSAAAAPTAAPTPRAGGTGTGGAGTGGTGAGETQGQLSGLPWMSGVYPSHVLAQVLSFGNWRGRANDVAHVFTVRSQGWGPMVEPRWPLDLYKSFPGTLIISQPTYPKGQGNNAACARGEYDKYWKTFGTFLKNNGRANSIVRVGWEFNGTFMYWHSDAAGTEFRDCFRKISTAIRSTDPEVKIDWTFNAHASPVPKGGSPWAAYPGDEYVDYVGIDSYDHYPPSRDEATWKRQCDDPNGLCYLLEFARDHDKLVGVGEWGVASCSRNGGGDNAFYIRKMFETFTKYSDVMGYEAYFHDAAPGNVCSTIMNGGQNPKASAEYKRLFGSV